VHFVSPDAIRSLLDQFLREECVPYVCDLLRGALSATPIRPWTYTFNRFDVILDPENERVVIEDDLDVSEAGTQRVGIAEFTKALDRATARPSSG
jgi:hypothetical protein